MTSFPRMTPTRLALCAVFGMGLGLGMRHAWTFPTPPVASLETPKLLQPPRGLSAACVVTEVYDGDTLTGEFRIPFRIRLEGCWADEIKTKDDAAKARGLASRDHLKAFAEGKRGTVYVSWEDMRRGDELFSFGRMVATVWVDGVSLADYQITGGHASSTKNGKLGQ